MPHLVTEHVVITFWLKVEVAFDILKGANENQRNRRWDSCAAL